MDQKKPTNKIYLSRVEIESLLEFMDRYPDCEHFTLGASDGSIGQAIFAMTNYRKQEADSETIVDECFRDITDYDAF
jgi:hypothetical protein